MKDFGHLGQCQCRAFAVYFGKRRRVAAGVEIDLKMLRQPVQRPLPLDGRQFYADILVCGQIASGVRVSVAASVKIRIGLCDLTDDTVRQCIGDEITAVYFKLCLDQSVHKAAGVATDYIVNKDKLTTLMITHNMKDAITHGNRLIMLMDGKIILDIRGEEKKKLTVEDLLHKFEAASGEEFANDKAILG